MPRPVAPVLAALVATTPALSADQLLYDKKPWIVSFDEELRPLEPACILTTIQDEGALLLFQFPDTLDAKIVRASDIAMEPAPVTQVFMQVDEQEAWNISTDLRRFVVYMDNVPETLIGQMATGKTLKVDYNRDGRWDDRFSLEEAYPALQVMAECVTRLE